MSKPTEKGLVFSEKEGLDLSILSDSALKLKKEIKEEFLLDFPHTPLPKHFSEAFIKNTEEMVRVLKDNAESVLKSLEVSGLPELEFTRGIKCLIEEKKDKEELS